MDFAETPRAIELREALQAFMDEHVYPSEAEYYAERAAGVELPDVIERLKAEARRRGLWNLFLPHPTWGAGLSNLEYAPLAEILGRSLEIAPEATNSMAPDTGNAEILVHFGSDEQQQRWLRPLLDGEIRSTFAMTEPDVASSDATNIQTSIRRDGDEYVIDGRKWWASGTAHPLCRFLIVMGITDDDPAAERHRRHGMVIVPLDTPGVTLVRNLTMLGHHDRMGHGELRFEDVRVPAANLLGEEGSGFAIAQARLGPGRIHHCMRVIGAAERALEMMSERALSRTTFGSPLSERSLIQSYIAESRIELEQVRLLVLKAAWMMDTVGNKAARTEIAAIKVAAARTAISVVDRAIQIYGGAGIGPDTPLPFFLAWARHLRIADGPDEVHLRTIARSELARAQERLDRARPAALA
jgi:acyl-CoA dehydrogenase